MKVIQTQEQANAFWANHEIKKWVVRFTRGPQRARQIKDIYVSSRTAEGALRGGREAMKMFGHTWGLRAQAQTRLATAQDLGCVHVASSS